MHKRFCRNFELETATSNAVHIFIAEKIPPCLSNEDKPTFTGASAGTDRCCRFMEAPVAVFRSLVNPVDKSIRFDGTNHFGRFIDNIIKLKGRVCDATSYDFS